MAQKTNLNISPYFDDFDAEKNFYKVLFNPGRPIQSRELNTFQSILQNQIESFGSHVFKEGSKVIPGGTHYDSDYHAVKINSLSFGVEVSQYVEQYIGKKIRGQTSGLTASVKQVVFPNDQVSDITLYVKYLDSDQEFSGGTFIDGETLLSTDPISYGVANILINGGAPFASLISSGATLIGSAVSIDNGIYFVRGTFATVSAQTLILEYFSQFPSYRVGLKVSEDIITAKEDNTLYDNAKGFNNFSSPGADRLKITLSLTKKRLDDYNDTNFVELFRIEDGIIKKTNTETDYAYIKDYMAKRTHDESGNYTVNPFTLSLNNSVNDFTGSNGKYLSGELTTQGNTPSDDLMCVTVSPGKAYVKGYDVEKTYTTVIDVDKPRDTQKIDDVLVPFDIGNRLTVNNVFGSPDLKESIDFYNRRRDSSNSAQGDKIGDARAYIFKVTDAAYTGASTTWDLYLYEIEFFTELTLVESLTSSQIKQSSRVVGQSSGAIGYAVSDGDGTSVVKIRVESGRFVQNETIFIDGIEENKSNIKSLKVFSSSDIKSVFKSGSPNFIADVVLKTRIAPGYSLNDTVSIERVDDNSATLKSPKGLSGITENTIVKYTIPGNTVETFNRVSAVGASTLTLVPIESVTSVNSGSVPGASDGNSGTIENVTFKIGASEIDNPEKAFLYSILPNNTISSVDLDGSQLTFTAQTISSYSLAVGSDLVASLSPSDFNLPGNSGTVKFDTFDAEKYSIHYTDGTIEPLTQDKVVFTNNFSTLTFNNISNKTIDSVTASFIKSGIQSKAKVLKKSDILDVTLSKYKSSGSNSSNSVNDSLTYNRYYGLRVQDEEICLRNPDAVRVISVYEAIDSDVSFDTVVIGSEVETVLVGEDFEGVNSQSVARVVSKSSNSVDIVYLNGTTLQVGEEIRFRSTNTVAIIESISPGSYKDITSDFKLDKGQKDEYYDYSRLVRNNGAGEPSKKLKIVYDRYHVNADDSGDLYSVLSYFADDYGTSIPKVGRFGIRASDIIDFRPRVTNFTGSSSSPFSKSGRTFGNSPKVIITPNEASLISYDVYLPRIDKLYLDSTGSFALEKGIPSLNPKQPRRSSDELELASIILPPYLFDTSDARIDMVDNRRYTMRDIGILENRVENLEEVTSLSLLEVNTQTLQIKDADGFDRFKTGFFADSFNDTSLLNLPSSLSEVDMEVNELTPLKSRNVVTYKVLPESDISIEDYDSSVDYKLLDSRIRKTGNVITLDYQDRDWITQELATRVENVNPFHVIQYVGDIRLNPFEDTWIRTVQLSDNTIRHSLALNLESQVNTERVELNNVSNGISAGNHGLGQNEFRDTFLNLNMSASRPLATHTVTSNDSDSASSTERTFIDSEIDQFMRSRNTEFSSSNLKSFTRYYPFLDGFGNIDVTPKLIQVTKDLQRNNPGTNGTFQTGETVSVWNDGIEIMTFRLAESNHKSGAFNNPNRTYDVNPYNRSETIPSGYSQSSTTLNIDTLSLSDDANGELYGGYLVETALLIGTDSGATAYVNEIRLVTDNYGDLIGTFFVREPNTQPPPPLRIPTGTKTFKLSSSPQNENGIVGSTNISSAESTYVSRGTINTFQNTIRITELSASLSTTNNIRVRTLTATRGESISTIETPEPVRNFITNEFITNNVTNVTRVTRNITNVTNVRRINRITNNINNIVQQQRYTDPLAQTFLVGTARGLNSFNDDENGAFLTGVDLFFASVDSGNAPITIQVRTTEFGIPTLTVIGDPVTLRPTDTVNGTSTILRDNVSVDGSVATRVTFPYPIFLPPSTEYAIVLMAPESDEYTVFTARMGENTLNTANLPDAESVRYTQQFAIGSLFKSQNGSTWTPDQYEDMKFKLYKAEFTSTEGVAYLGNSDLTRSNSYERLIQNNAITVLPRKLKVGIDTTSNADVVNTLTPGRKIQDLVKTYVTGFVEKVGSKATSIGIETGGRDYTEGSSTVNTFNVIGHGSGLTLSITANADGTITSASSSHPGRGYAIGDVIGIVTSSVTGTNNVPSGENAFFTVTSNGSTVDTLYLTNVSGDSFGLDDLVYYNDGGATVALGNTHVISSEEYLGDYYDGRHAQIRHFDHGMYAGNNLVELKDVSPDTPRIKTTSAMTRDSASVNVLASDISKFTKFEGVNVSATNPGYILIGNEIISYTGASSTQLTGIDRGLHGTVAVPHAIDTFMQKYEIAGVSLRRINKKHNIVDTDIDIDSYYIFLQTGSVDSTFTPTIPVGANRSTDGSLSGSGALTFNSYKNVGGNLASASENVLYDTVNPMVSAIVPGTAVSLDAQVRTVSATSVRGSETSFLDQPYVDVELNKPNKMSSLRMVASKVNADQYLTDIPRSRSNTLALSFATTNYNLSPMLFLDSAAAEYTKHRINNPISNYVTDKRTSSVIEDPHEAIYVSKTIRLQQPSNTLRVNITAHRDESADFRVMYSLLKPEGSSQLQVFEMFPGYDNLTTDLDTDGFLDVVDPSKNSGLPDKYVSGSVQNQFSQYEYTAPNVGPFIGFAIKIVMSSTKMDKYPRIRDIRSIGLA